MSGCTISCYFAIEDIVLDPLSPKDVDLNPNGPGRAGLQEQSIDNALLSQDFIDDACLTPPLPAQWPGLAAAALPKRLLQRFLIMLAVCAIGFATSHRVFAYIDWPLIVLPLLALLTLWFALVPLQLRHCRYVLRQRDFVYCHGLLWRKADLLPLRRLQHVTVSQGALQKLFGLATLELYSAGSSGAEIRLADITHQQAMLLSELLSALIPQDEPPLAEVGAALTPASTATPTVNLPVSTEPAAQQAMQANTSAVTPPISEPRHVD